MTEKQSTPDKPARKSADKAVETLGAASPVAAGGFFGNGVERMFDDMFRRWNGLSRSDPFRTFGSIAPGGESAMRIAADITENKDHYAFSFELPGVSRSDVNLEIGDGILTVSGEKKEQKEEDTKGHYLRERRYGKVQRSFRLPDDAEQDGARAAFENGVLKVTVPRTPSREPAPKKIKIESA